VAYGGRAQGFVYRHSPPPLRDLAATCYAARTYPLKYGRHFREHMARLAEHERLSNDELEGIQLRALKALLGHAAARVPYYRALFREQGFDPERVRGLADLERVPLLTKDAVRRNASDLLSEGEEPARLVCIHTSGTTGTPLDLYQSRALFQKEYAFWWFHRSWAGVRRGCRTATLAGHPVVPAEQDRVPFWVRNRLENQMLFSSYHMSPGNLEHYCCALERFRPELVHGYPSSIYLVALRLNDDGVRTVRPRAVFTSSETLLEHQRAEIERAFGCKAYSYYGNAERAGYIGECERGSFHVMAEHSIAEFLNDDGAPVRPGEEGVLVCTNVDNLAMPLIRYVTGDVAVPLPAGERCPCGRGGRLVRSLVGRVEDYVVTPDGAHVGRLDHILKGVRHVREAQVYQPAVDRVVLKVSRDEGYSEADERTLLANTRERLGTSMDIAFEYVDRVERTAGGKFRFVVSDMPLNERLRVRRER